MSLFNGEYRNPIHDMLADAIGITLPAPLADAVDAIHEVEEAGHAQDRRTISSGLTVGDIDDHVDALTTLSRDVLGHEFDSLAQIAEAIDRARDDFLDVFEAAL